jgi:hypothetical protein
MLRLTAILQRCEVRIATIPAKGFQPSGDCRKTTLQCRRQVFAQRSAARAITLNESEFITQSSPFNKATFAEPAFNLGQIGHLYRILHCLSSQAS